MKLFVCRRGAGGVEVGGGGVGVGGGGVGVGGEGGRGGRRGEGNIRKVCKSRLRHGDDYTPLSNCRRQHTIQHHKAH